MNCTPKGSDTLTRWTTWADRTDSVTVSTFVEGENKLTLEEVEADSEATDLPISEQRFRKRGRDVELKLESLR